ncbi:MAG: hypothetical protein QXZ44_03075 [Ferroplasma sp.]
MNFSIFLNKLLHERTFYDEINLKIDAIVAMIDSGNSSKKIEAIYSNNFQYLYEFAKSRIKARKKFSREKIFLDAYAAMYSTPEIVGKYRSKRLASNSIIDIGSGAGMQAIMFACNSHVAGIEIDRNRYMMSLLNRKAYDSTAEFINEDALKSKINFSNSIIFSDPLRPVNSEERTFSGLMPDPLAILKVAHGYKGYAFDLPPQMADKNILLHGEREYISINGVLNRLTAYSENISEYRTSAVLLPQNKKIGGIPSDFMASPEELKKDFRYIYLPDISIIYARLLNDIVDDSFTLAYRDRRRFVFASDALIQDFPGEVYQAIAYVEWNGIIDSLVKFNAGRVFFRFGIETEDYYAKKNSIERQLAGEVDFYIFKNFNKYILAIKNQ